MKYGIVLEVITMNEYPEQKEEFKIGSFDRRAVDMALMAIVLDTYQPEEWNKIMRKLEEEFK